MIPRVVKNRAPGLCRPVLLPPLVLSHRPVATHAKTYTPVTTPRRDPRPRSQSNTRASFSSTPEARAIEAEERHQRASHLWDLLSPDEQRPPPFPQHVAHRAPRDLSQQSPWIPQAELAGSNSADESSESPESIISSILLAVQSHDSAATYRLLSLLVAASSHHDVLPALEALPRTSIAAIFQLIDPFRSGEHIDYTHNLRVTERLQEYSSVNVAVDEVGVRHVYKDVLAVLESFTSLLHEVHGNLLPSEYQVLLHCAGATSDIAAVRRIWRLMHNPYDPEGQITRDAAIYNSFMRARFVTDPLYTQNDLARTMFRPRSISNRRMKRLGPRMKLKLERIRLYRALHRRYNYGADPRMPAKDIQWATSSRVPLRRIWRRLLLRGVVPDEKLLSAFILAHGRTGQYRPLMKILKTHFGFITWTRADHRSDPLNSFKADAANQILAHKTASASLVNAVVTSLGMLGAPVLAKRFLEFVSQEYGFRIDRRTWSILLSYTYMASTGIRREWEVYGAGRENQNQIVTPTDVIAVWDMVPANRFIGEPKFEDRDKYIKALIQACRFDDALVEMERGVEEYRMVTNKVQQALFASLYPSPPPSCYHEFLRCKARQHTTWYSIAAWCRMWLWQMSTSLSSRGAGPAITEVFPKFVAGFKEFCGNPIEYRTDTGIVRLYDNAAQIRSKWKEEVYDTPFVEITAPDFQQPILGEDGAHQLDDLGRPLHRTYKKLVSKQITKRVRVRKTSKWERDGIHNYCTNIDDRELPSLLSIRTARCIEW